MQDDRCTGLHELGTSLSEAHDMRHMLMVTCHVGPQAEMEGYILQLNKQMSGHRWSCPHCKFVESLRYSPPQAYDRYLERLRRPLNIAL